MPDVKRKLKIEQRSSSVDFNIDLDENVLGVTIENTGTSLVFVAWNENASPGKGTTLPGTSKSFGLGWPYCLSGQKLSIAFDNTGSPNTSVIIFRDGGPISNC